jgi:hypothetical protein
MEIGIAILGIVASVISYKIGYKRGKKDGHTVGFTHGMFKANELQDTKNPITVQRVKPFVGVKNRLTRASCPAEPVWIG